MRVLTFCLLIALTLALPWWAVLPLWAVYAFRYVAYELVIFAILLDAYVGYVVPLHVFYTLLAVILCVGMEWLKPRMSFNETSW